MNAVNSRYATTTWWQE